MSSLLHVVGQSLPITFRDLTQSAAPRFRDLAYVCILVFAGVLTVPWTVSLAWLASYAIGIW